MMTNNQNKQTLTIKNFLDSFKSSNFSSTLNDDFNKLRDITNEIRLYNTKSVYEGERECNRRKNRYRDILPYDETRVKLKTNEDDETSYLNGTDYINASFIQNSLDEYYKYIACQGPTKETVVDFIRMLKLYNIKLVICACNEYEGQKLKCHRYWTDKMNQNYNFYKNYYVSLKCEPIELDGCIIRELVVRYNNNNSSSNNDQNIIHEYEFTQFHFTNWPDHGVPDNIEPIMNILKEVRLRMFQNNNESEECVPLSSEYMAVHCSAGCGRTGTIIAIDQVWTLIEENKLESDFNLFKIAKALREQRIAMIQTFSQYQFFARAVAFLFENFMLKQQKLVEKYINVTSNHNNSKFEKFIAPLKVNDDDNENNNQNEELNVDTNNNTPVDRNNNQKSINNNLLTPPKSPYELNSQQKVSNKKLTIDSFKKKVNKVTNFLTPSQKKYNHQHNQIDSAPLTIPQTTISTSSSSSSNQNTPASSNASPNSTTSSSSSSSTNPNSTSYSNYYMRPSNLNNLTEEEANLLKFETPPKSSNESSNLTLRSKKYPAQISTPITTSLLVSKPSNLQFGGNTHAKFNNQDDDDENNDYLKYIKKISPSSPTSSSDFLTPSQTPSNIESCSTPSRSTPTMARKLFTNSNNNNTGTNHQESESSTSISTTTQRTDDLTIDAMSSGSAFTDRTGSNQRIESGSAREFLSNRFNMNLQSPSMLENQYIRNYNNLSSKYLTPNDNSNNSTVYARVPIVNDQQKSNLHLSKSLKLVENQIKFSKSEKTDLIPPSKAEIYDNLQLKNQEEYYNYNSNYNKNSSNSSTSNNNVSQYSYSISQNNKNNNKLEIKESNDNDSDEISLEAPPKAPVRSKLKRFIPAKDLAKNIDLNSTNQKTMSSLDTGGAYCDIPSAPQSNLSNNCRKFNDIYTSHSQYTTTISNNNTQENQSFKKLLKSDKLMSKNRTNEVPNIVLRNHNNEIQQQTYQTNDMIINKQPNVQRTNTTNFRNGLFIRDFELQHDLKIKPQQITISTQENNQQQHQQSLTKNLKCQKGDLNPMNRTYSKGIRKPTPSNTFEQYELEKYRAEFNMNTNNTNTNTANNNNNNNNTSNNNQYYSHHHQIHHNLNNNEKATSQINLAKNDTTNISSTANSSSTVNQNGYDFNMNNYIIQQHHLNLNYHQANLNKKMNEMNSNNRKSLNNFNLRQSQVLSNYDAFLKYNNLTNNNNNNNNKADINGGSNNILKRNSNIITGNRTANNNHPGNRSTQIFNV